MDDNVPKNDKGLDLIKDLAVIAIEIFQCHQEMTSGVIKKKTKDIILDKVKKYQKVVKAENAGFDGHKKPYLEVYENFKREILDTAENDGWIRTNRVDICLNKNVGIKLSICYERALKIRELLEDSKTGNANIDDEIECKYEYLYADELLYKFLLVVREALPKKHRDSKKLNITIETLSDRVGSFDDSSEETTRKKESGANNMLEGIKNMFPSMSNDGEVNINGNGFMDIIGGVFGNKEITGQIGNAVKSLEGVLNNKNDSTENVVENMFDALKPVLKPTLDSITKNVIPPGAHLSSDAEEIAANTQNNVRENVASMGIEFDD